MPDDTEDLILEGEELTSEGPLLEEGVGRVHIPSKGKLFDSDGRVQVAIIRPCQSRGKRLRGLAPIYEAAMLGKNASVFTDWHMWMGHLPAALSESLEKLEEATGRRLFSELGGRVLETWFDPEYRTKRDDDNGYRPGAIMGKVIPYEASKKILEADPDGLHVSIAAWPTKARSGSPSWNPAGKGMIIEGFRRSPRGSVDWVLRGGAGGAPVKEAELLAVSVVESLYDPPGKDRGTKLMPEITDKQAQILETLAERAPALLEGLGLPKPEGTPKVTEAAPAAGTLTVEQLNEALTKQAGELTTAFDAKLEERDELIEEEVNRRLEERDSARELEKVAHGMIEESALPVGWRTDLKRRYSVLPSGPSDALLVEADEEKSLDAEGVLRAKVEEDIKHAVGLINEAGGQPRVRGLGGGGSVKESAQTAAPAAAKRKNAFDGFLTESAGGADGFFGEKPKTKTEEVA